MKYISICSGIEAASTAWDSLGWQPIAFSEIEPFPSAVLAHHWPDVPNLGDMTKHNDWPTTLRPDLIVGGTPCQAFSVAGLRKGLEDPRGNLTLTFLAIVAQHRPAWVVWENVPGVLSDRTGAFGSFLSGLAELGYGWAYRVLDAQYFGVAQRRRRVFVVASLGGWGCAAAVLFERESLLWHPAPSREKGQGVAAYTKGSFGGYSEGCGTLRANGGDLGGGSETLAIPAIANCLQTTCDDYSRADGFNMIPVTHCIAENIIGRQDHNGGNGQGHQEELLYTLNTVAAPAVAFQPGNLCRKAGAAPSEKCFPTLGATTQGDQAPCVAFKFDPLSSNSMKSRNPESGCREVQLSNCLDTSRLDPAKNQGGVAVAFPINTQLGLRGAETSNSTREGIGIGDDSDPSFTLQRSHSHAVATPYAVRRLTPTECERLQGFPDGHTAIPWRNKTASECPDGPRYKALGNSMAVPVMRWIGERIKYVETL
jgi:DNA (cytosine-5)-methyltransferase 1